MKRVRSAVGSNGIFILFLVMGMLCTYGVRAGSFPDSVAEIHLGSGGGYGMGSFPQNILGPPSGGADSENPQESASELLSLGDGGWITLEYDSSIIVNGPGADFIVFENVFVPQSNPEIRFCETALVAVSQDGDHFTTFTFNFIPRQDDRVGYLDQYTGLAGVHPTLSNSTNGISPTDPSVAGGDAFDLSDVGLSWIRFIRIKDTGIPGTSTETLDDEGDEVDDPGNAAAFLDPATTKVGFDLDAVAAIHTAPRQTEIPTGAANAWMFAP